MYCIVAFVKETEKKAMIYLQRFEQYQNTKTFKSFSSGADLTAARKTEKMHILCIFPNSELRSKNSCQKLA